MNKLKITVLFLALISGWAFACHAEIITFSSVLTWRQDGKGDFFLPVPSEEGTYEAKDIVSTKGYITRITATWDFEGEVSLEASVDGGISYTPLIWGEPKSSGFAKGKKLRWKAALKKGSMLREVKISYTDSSGTTANFGEPKLSGFKFRKALYLRGSSSELFNYQVKVKVGESDEVKPSDLNCGGKINKGFNDIRFTAADGQSLLSFYRESVRGKKPKRVASFWVKIPQLPPEGLLIYLYYGNAKAKDTSSPAKVFDFFDDFEREGINQDVWKVEREEGGQAKISKGRLLLKGAEVVSRNFKLKGGIVEYAAVNPEGGATSLIIKKSLLDDEDTYAFYSSAYKDAEHCIAAGGVVKENFPRPTVKNTLYHYRLLVDKEKLLFYRYLDYSGEDEARVFFWWKNLSPRHIGFRSITAPNTKAAYYDWVRVRKLAKPTPSVIRKKTKEEAVNPPLFQNTEVAPGGDLVLKEGARRGSYLSKRISAHFFVRILVPVWEGGREGAPGVDISADGGKSYKKHCKKDFFYYASHLDFNAGRQLRYRVNFSKPKKGSLAEEAPNRYRLKKITLDYRPGKITLISPNGRERWHEGEKREILWTAMDYEKKYPLKIDYSLDAGKSYLPIIYYTENDGKYIWDIPQGISGKAKVRVSDAWDTSIGDYSDSFFYLTGSKKSKEFDYTD